MEQDKTSTMEVVRPVEGRMIAGVAMGLSNRFGVADWIIRVGFIVAAFVGFTGLIAYLACWALIRSEDEEEPPATRFFDGAVSAQAWVGIGFIVVATIVLLDRFTWLPTGVIWSAGLLIIGLLLYTGQLRLPVKATADGDSEDVQEGVQQVTEKPADASPTGTKLLAEKEILAPPKAPRPPKPPRPKSRLGQITIGLMLLAVGALAALDIVTPAVNPGPRHYLALATVVLGVGLMVGSVWGRARWLILLGVVLISALAITPFNNVWQSQGSWVAPASFAELQPEYDLDVGRLTIDLTLLPWDGEEIDLSLSADVGEVRVIVPMDVAISGTASIDVGRISVPGISSGWSFTSRSFNFNHAGYPDADFGDGMTRGHATIRSSVDVGSIRIIHSFVYRSEQ